MIAFFRNPSLRSSATTSAKAVQPLTPYGRYSARTSRPTNLCILFIRSGLAEIAQARVPSSFRHGFCPRYRPCFLGIPPRRTLKQWHRLRHELSRHGGQQKARSHYPQPIRSITPYRYLLVLDVKRYFKPLWKPGHLLDNNLKSCGYCLRPTAQIFLRAKANESIHE